MTESQLEVAVEEALRAEEEIESDEGGLAEAAVGAPGAGPDEEAHPPADEFDDPEAIEPEGLPDAEGLTSIREILGVPLWYERAPATPGPRSFPVAPEFVPLLEQTVRAVRNRAPKAFGGLERIVSAGMFVQKTGAHGRGHACDWDRLVFENVEIAPLAKDHLSPSPAVRQRYWAFAALCRSVMAPTLHGESDSGPHDDHVHQADNLSFGFDQGMPATVTLCQAVLNEIHGQTPRLAVDGRAGPKTNAALDAALARLRLDGGLDDDAVWQLFLRRSARLGFVLSVRQ